MPDDNNSVEFQAQLIAKKDMNIATVLLEYIKVNIILEYID